MAEELKIIIEADVSQAQQALSGIQDSATKTATSLKSIAPAANTAANTVSQIATKSIAPIKTLQTGVSKLGDSIETLRAKVLARQSFINTTKDVQQVEILNKEIIALEAEIKRVQNIGREGVAFKSDALISGANTAFSALRKIAFILPGIGVAGILGGLSDVLINLGKRLFDVTDDAKKSNTAFEDLTKTLTELQSVSDIRITASGTTQGELEKVNALAQAVKNTNLSYGERKAAIEELQKINKSYFGDLTLEASSMDTLTDRVNEYTQALIQAAVVKGFQDEISKFAPQLQKANKAFNDNIEAVKKWQDALDAFKQTPEFLGHNAAQQIEDIGSFASKNIDIFKKYQDAQKAIISQTPELQKARSAYADIEDAINSAVLQQLKFKPLEDPTKAATKGLDELDRKLIQLAKDAQKAFNIPITLKFDDTDTAKQQLDKAVKILQGIKDFSIKARVDIQLPDIKELPKEQVEKFFKNVPDALQDAIDKGLIEAQGKDLNVDTGPFAKEIAALIEKFNQAGLTIPVVFDLKDADLLKKLQDAFPIEQIQKNVDELKKSLGTEDTFQGFIRDLIRIGDEGEKAFKETQKQALAAGKSIEQAFNEASAARDKIGGLTKEAGEAALVLQQTLAPAFEDLFTAILQGQAPLDAFFKSLIRGIDQLIAKLIAAALEALILSSITGGIGGFGGIFKALLGFAKGGDPPTDRPSIVGEKGWELIVPKTSMHVFTHEQSKNILSTSSVKENESIKEYLIANRVSQQIKEHFNKAVSTITANTYKLHETISSSITSLKEFNQTTNNFYKESFSNISSTIEKLISEKPKATIVKDSSHYETFKNDTSFTSNILSAIQRIVISKEATENSKEIQKLNEKISSHKSLTIERITNNFFSTDTLKDLKSFSIHDLIHKFHIPAFAQGGAVFGPTLAILGEGFGVSRSNPEFVGTASQLKGIQGGVFDVNVNVDGELSFSMGKLAVALNREVRSQLRTSGKNPF